MASTTNHDKRSPAESVTSAVTGSPLVAAGGAIFVCTAVAVLLLTLNLSTFPEPPEESGLVDVGPLVGLWYLAAAIRMRSSLGWVDRTASGSAPPPPRR